VEIANCLKCMQPHEEAIETYKKALLYNPDRGTQLQIFHSLQVCAERRKVAGFQNASGLQPP